VAFGAACAAADRGSGTARGAAKAGFSSKAAIIAASLTQWATDVSSALGSRAAAGLAADSCRVTAALQRAALPGGAAPTLALAVGRTTGVIDAKVVLGAARGGAGTGAGATDTASALLTGGATHPCAHLRRFTAAAAQAHRVEWATCAMAGVFRTAARSTQANFARPATMTTAPANDRDTALPGAHFILAAAAPEARISLRATPILRADAPLRATGIAALVLQGAADVIDAPGILSATHSAADRCQWTADASMTARALSATGVAARTLLGAALAIHASRPCRTTCAVAGMCLVATAASQTALVMLAALRATGEGIRAAGTGEAG
jgi:hypothetical protein